MKTVKVRLGSTEVLDGVKRRPGDEVELPADHPVVAKTLASEAIAKKAPEKKSAGRD